MKSIRQELREQTGTVSAHAARKQLRRWNKSFDQSDIDDIVSEAWLKEHSEEIIREELSKLGLEWTPENVGEIHRLIDERLRDSRPSALGARAAAQRWADERAAKAEDSVFEVIKESENGDEVLRADVITHGPAIFNEDHVVLNDRCTPQQIAEEESYPVAYADREGMLTKVAAVLTPSEVTWLLRYYGATSTKTGAERNKCHRLIEKATRRLRS